MSPRVSDQRICRPQVFSYAIHDIKKCLKLPKLLEIILAVGNYLNGTGPRGGAYGFKLEVLCTRARTHARTHARTRARTHKHHWPYGLKLEVCVQDPMHPCTRTRARTRARTHTHRCHCIRSCNRHWRYVRVCTLLDARTYAPLAHPTASPDLFTRIHTRKAHACTQTYARVRAHTHKHTHTHTHTRTHTHTHTHRC